MDLWSDEYGEGVVVVRDCPRSLMFSYRSWLKMYEDKDNGKVIKDKEYTIKSKR